MIFQRLVTALCIGATTLFVVSPAAARGNILTCTHPETGKTYTSDKEIPNHGCFYPNWEDPYTIERREQEKRYELNRARQKRAAAELARRPGATIGMTETQVLATAWGKPRRINQTTNKRGTSEQWVYGGNNYLYFENGILVSIHTSDGR